MTTHTPLSPAAQAVRAAVLATYADSIPKDDNLWALDRDSVAAALRAAADCLTDATSAHTLYAIAAELEGTGSYCKTDDQ